MSEAYAIGIDLGTSYSCLCVWNKNAIQLIPSKDGSTIIPTCVAFTNSKCLVGVDAKNQAHLNPKNTIFEVLRLLGRSSDDTSVRNFKKTVPFKMISVKDTPHVQVDIEAELQTFAPEEIIFLFFRELKEYTEAFLGYSVPNAVISTSPSMNRLQIKHLKEAACAAGFENAKITTSQNAAGLVYAFQNNELDNERKIMVIDIGGAFTVASIFVVDGPIVETVNSSSIEIGGENFDQRLLNFLAEEFKQMFRKDLKLHPGAFSRLRRVAERAKITLSAENETSVKVDNILDSICYTTRISRRQLEDMCSDLFWDILRPIEEVLSEAKLDKVSMKDVVLVGGSSRIPKIQTLIQEYFNNKTLNVSMIADDCSGIGCALLGAALNGCEDDAILDMLLIDSLHLPLGIETAGGVMTKLIEKNTFPPISVSKTFTTFNDNEDMVTILIYEGISTMTKYNTLLGSLTITGIQAALRGVPKIEITFELDENLTLTVTARERDTGHFGETVIRDVKVLRDGEELVATQLVSCNR